MRSRYTAYVRGDVDYLLATQDVSTRAIADRASIAARSRDTEWLGLEIVNTERGEPDDDDGIVEFIARGSTRGTPFAQRERSQFRRHDGRWYYLDGTHPRVPTRVTATVGRNESCPCGSGMKYKRCHGA